MLWMVPKKQHSMHCTLCCLNTLTHVYELGDEANAEEAYSQDLLPVDKSRTKMVLARLLHRRDELAGDETVQDAWALSHAQLLARAAPLLPAPVAAPPAAPPVVPPAGPGGGRQGSRSGQGQSTRSGLGSRTSRTCRRTSRRTSRSTWAQRWKKRQSSRQRPSGCTSTRTSSSTSRPSWCSRKRARKGRPRCRLRGLRASMFSSC